VSGNDQYVTFFPPEYVLNRRVTDLVPGEIGIADFQRCHAFKRGWLAGHSLDF
jgi:hypothetical protein